MRSLAVFLLLVLATQAAGQSSTHWWKLVDTLAVDTLPGAANTLEVDTAGVQVTRGTVSGWIQTARRGGDTLDDGRRFAYSQSHVIADCAATTVRTNAVVYYSATGEVVLNRTYTLQEWPFVKPPPDGGGEAWMNLLCNYARSHRGLQGSPSPGRSP
jgi:hypothetical protein